MSSLIGGTGAAAADAELEEIGCSEADDDAAASGGAAAGETAAAAAAATTGRAGVDGSSTTVARSGDGLAAAAVDPACSPAAAASASSGAWEFEEGDAAELMRTWIDARALMSATGARECSRSGKSRSVSRNLARTINEEKETNMPIGKRGDEGRLVQMAADECERSARKQRRMKHNAGVCSGRMKELGIANSTAIDYKLSFDTNGFIWSLQTVHAQAPEKQCKSRGNCDSQRLASAATNITSDMLKSLMHTNGRRLGYR